MGNKAKILALNDKLDRDLIEFKEAERSSKEDNPKKVLPYFM